MLSNSKRLFLAVLLVFSVVLAVAVGFFLIDYIEEKNAMTDGGVNVDLTEELNAIYIDGELYLPRKGVENYLIIGVDKAGESDSDQIGQADFLMVLSFDSNDGTYTLIPINRDTITDVYETDLFGNQRVVEKQIALSHAYESSEGLTNKGKCENTVKSASAILCGMRFHGYMSMTMDAVKIIVDSIGGVEVVLDEDYSEADPAFTKGASVLLDGDGAMRFVRMRGGLDDSTNIARMHRQELFPAESFSSESFFSSRRFSKKWERRILATRIFWSCMKKPKALPITLRVRTDTPSFFTSLLTTNIKRLSPWRASRRSVLAAIWSFTCIRIT